MKIIILTFTITVFATFTAAAQQPNKNNSGLKHDSIPGYPGYQSSPVNTTGPAIKDSSVHYPAPKMWKDSLTGPKSEKNKSKSKQ